MSGPVPDGDPSILRLVLRSLDRIELSVKELQERMTAQFDRADEKYATREDLRRVEGRLDGWERARGAAKWPAVASLLTTFGLLLAALTLVIAHWK
jgi:hypothetical protein